MPRVSVIIPAYNAAALLEDALHSVLAQTESDLEVIVVDDASTDSTAELASAFKARDARVRVLVNERNVGPAASRNRAVEAGTGEWLAPLDADDEWLPRRLEKLLELADRADVVSDDICFVKELGSNVKRSELGSLLKAKRLKLSAPSKLGVVDFVRHDLGFLKPIVRKSFLIDHQVSYDSRYRLAEDFYFYLRLLLCGASWLQIPEGYYLYRRNRGSISRDLYALAQAHVECSAALLNEPVVQDDSRLAAALRSLNRDWRAVIAYLSVLELVKCCRPAPLARLLVERPEYVGLIARKVTKRMYRGALR